MGAMDILLVLFSAVGALCGMLVSLKRRKELEDELQTAKKFITAHREKEKQSAEFISGLETKSKEAQALYMILERLSSTLEKEPLMKGMCDAFLFIFEASRCKIYVVDERKNIMEVFNAEGKEQFKVDVIKGDGMELTFHQMSELGQLEPFILQRESLQRSDHGLIIPLQRKTKECGLMILEKQQTAARFTFQEEKLLRTVGQPLVMTLENVRMYEDAIRDALTELYIKRYFLLRLEEQARLYARHRALPFSMVMMDIDFFKKLNDTYGHMFGDEVLCGVARVLLLRFRTTDIAARFGGEEFSIMLLGAEKADAVKVVEGIREKIQALSFTAALNGKEENVSVTASFGIASCPEDGQTLEELLERADAAMYQAKHEGRNRVVAWGGLDKAEVEAETETEMETDAKAVTVAEEAVVPDGVDPSMQ